MKSSQITLIVIGFILLALMATNPSLEEHKESVKNMFLKEIENKKSKKVNEVVASIGSVIADRFIDQMVSRNNYYLFSTTKYSIEDESKIIGLGILGIVFLKDYESTQKSFNSNNNDIKSKNFSDTELLDKKWSGVYTEKVDQIYKRGSHGICLADGNFEILNLNNELVMYNYQLNGKKVLKYHLIENNILNDESEILIFEIDIKMTQDLNEQNFKKIEVRRRNNKYFIKNLSYSDCSNDYEFKRS